jgi:glycosyltransferase involved in cell wall biosynthesis
MALGCPVVATRVGGVPEMIEDGRSGIIVEPREVPALAAALAAIVADPAAARSMAERARERYDRRFGLQRMIAAYQELYLRAAGMVA